MNEENRKTEGEHEEEKENKSAVSSAATVLENEIKVTVDFGSDVAPLSLYASPYDNFNDLRQHVIELNNGLYTCFRLEYNGTIMNPFQELSEAIDCETVKEISLRVILDHYTERESLYHAFRLLDNIRSGCSRQSHNAELGALMSVYPQLVRNQCGDVDASRNTSHAQFKDFSGEQLSLQYYVKLFEDAAQASEEIDCLQDFGLSAWNPVPPYWALQGHLFYLRVTVLEGQQFHITSRYDGYCVNQSSNTKFDPSPNPKYALHHSLSALLSSLSPKFQAGLADLLKSSGELDQTLKLQVSKVLQQPTWINTHSVYTADITRTQSIVCNPFLENKSNLRDWNDEIQSVREMPYANLQERVLRERLLQKTLNEFTESAMAGAIEVVNGNVPALNPTEPLASQMYIHNNIFFSYGMDSIGIFDKTGGNEASRHAVGKDVAYIRLLTQSDRCPISLLGTCLIDFAGHRIVAQTLIPGIFRQQDEGATQVVYGKVDGEDTFVFDKKLDPLLKEVSAILHLKKHPVVGNDGKTISMFTSMDAKGLKGTDGRSYLLDLYSLFPLDIGFLEEIANDDSKLPAYPHTLAYLRPELIQSIWETKLKNYAEAKAAKLKESVPKDELEKIPDISLNDFDYTLNPDVFRSDYKVPKDYEQTLKKDEEAVKAVSELLRNDIIPSFVKTVCTDESAMPVDGIALARMMHKRGINMRYLGKVAELAASQYGNDHPLVYLAELEMLARAVKHVFSNNIAKHSFYNRASSVAYLLCCIFSEDEAFKDSPVYKEYLQKIPSESFQTPTQVKESVAQNVASRFRYRIHNSAKFVKSPPLLRNICLKLGIQLLCRDYFCEPFVPAALQPATAGDKKSKKKKATKKKPSQTTFEPVLFYPTDILNILPLIKTCTPCSTLAREAFDACKLSIAQKDKNVSLSLLSESLMLHEQIYGILHAEVARAYCQVALLFYQLEDKEQALNLARKAVLVCERVLGFDSAETILGYMNLSLYEFSSGNIAIALAFCVHALKLWRCIFGPEHPDMITSFNNVAVMVQRMNNFVDSQKWFQASVDLSKKFFGNTLNTASLYFQLAQSMAFNDESRNALKAIRIAYDIYKEELGEDHATTKEAEEWLSKFTANAVYHAKHLKIQQLQPHGEASALRTHRFSS
ncbi:translation initiation factor eIF3 alpha subunit [Schizosaccharomyces japonicus yFS275]|uniref:Translation initiation factor eIF3 alpha subunit n=1 Tax=Schizosaccharomyces japonicus (strain yFS275 / FY16936) TaxID=402676 RepID=B6JYS3_SCHJY|nr:translation initiation factor eIF3 alpha subunit [Schizosaccharomyces japonicus yFS275]EEB06691.1 translation initiation factor eIF3 alpha subunit [Schizosaccharomyces japonicus yFS275]